MSVIHKQAWFTSDGRAFTDRAKAYEHEYQLNKRSTLDTFLIEGPVKNYNERGKASAERIVGDFIDHLDGMGLTMPWTLPTILVPEEREGIDPPTDWLDEPLPGSVARPLGAEPDAPPEDDVQPSYADNEAGAERK